MRKHLFGAILFCVIVKVAILVNLYALPKPLPVFESTECVFKVEPDLENNQKKLGQIKIQQAVYNVKKDTLDIQLWIEGNVNTIPIEEVTITIFNKMSPEKINNVAHVVRFEPSYNDLNSKIRKVSIPLGTPEWSTFKYENLYVSVRAGNLSQSYVENNLNETAAHIPVLTDKGKK